MPTPLKPSKGGNRRLPYVDLPTNAYTGSNETTRGATLMQATTTQIHTADCIM